MKQKIKTNFVNLKKPASKKGFGNFLLLQLINDFDETNR